VGRPGRPDDHAQRRKEATVVRYDSGWVATGPVSTTIRTGSRQRHAASELTEIKTHPGVVKGVWNVRRIRETGRV
jgi:hypothetical protein